MKIVFLVERATQFEAPFFRFAAGAPGHELRVLFTGAAPGAAVFDPELRQTISWGMPLLDGYPHAVAPARGRARWLARQLRRGSCDLLIANGYTRREYLLAAALARRAGIATALRLESVLWQGPPTIPTQSPPAARRGVRLLAGRLLYSVLLPRLYDLFLGVGTLTLDYLDACGVPAGRRGLFPYAVDVEHFRSRSCLAPAERAAARARRGLGAGQQAVLAV
ncbi:MAG TPA: hypothetical protein VE075_10205, partial [Thermoanaerobaculia bacterium]|nr:hypothetical protein [Thermoanaerobaculia bacterium]